MERAKSTVDRTQRRFKRGHNVTRGQSDATLIVAQVTVG